MSARRWCGRYCLRIRLLPTDRYRVWVSRRGARVTKFDVLPPVQLERALDHPNAFDEAARAAMSFFSVTDEFDEEAAEHSDAGFQVRRLE